MKIRLPSLLYMLPLSLSDSSLLGYSLQEGFQNKSPVGYPRDLSCQT